MLREQSLKIVKTYKVIKQVIWQHTIKTDADGNAIDEKDQVLDLDLLFCLMNEIKVCLKLYDEGLAKGLSPKRILKRLSMLQTVQAH